MAAREMLGRYRFLGGVVLGCVALTVGSGRGYAQQLTLRGHGLPPPGKPKRISGGESVPPLPLPATPLRRTERKREPSPPALLFKMAYTPPKWVTAEGKRVRKREWLNVTDDSRNLLQWINKQLSIRYRSLDGEWGKFSFDPTEIPVLYLTGHQPFPELSDKQIMQLRQYCLDGGTILANACCGNKEFAASFAGQIKRVFPNRELAALPSDHPVFHCFHKISEVQYQVGGKDRMKKPPYLRGINIGCRTAVFYAPFDLANGWYGQEPPDNYAAGRWIVGEDARQLGGNIMTYILANFGLGRFLAQEKVLYQKRDPTRDEFVLAQIDHGGDWDPNPSALPNLLRFLEQNSTLSVQFKRVVVGLGDASLFQYPIIYVTGHRDFKLTDPESQNLRAYLQGGGLLVADACCGRGAFDAAFRKELKRALPDRKLGLLPLDDPIYTAHFDARQVTYTPLVRAAQPNLRVPAMEVIRIDNHPAVIYSRFAMGNGWEACDHPYSKGYETASALKLGANVFLYGITH